MATRPALAVRNKNVVNNSKAAPAVLKPTTRPQKVEIIKEEEAVKEKELKKKVEREIHDHDVELYLAHLAKKRQLDENFLENAKINARQRAILVDWLAQIQSKFDLTSDTFFLACALLDRVMQPLEVTRENLQVIGLACIFVACKYEEVIVPHIDDFIYMSKSVCNMLELFAAERQVLTAIRGNLAFTYPCHYIRKIRIIMRKDQTINYELSKLLIDATTIDYKCCWWLPTEKAAVAFTLAFHITKQDFPQEYMDLLELKKTDIVPKVKLLVTRLPNYFDPSTKLTGLRLKYNKNPHLKQLVDALPNLQTHFQ
ncbi:G2/mitotic-specific cyclin-B [Aphelenchoides besseyi]|nr:G2/mitotic-specific cyclin-B [Aphelenchoides besseyi]KAI6207761.1 G2/mitotic-specific cyclin-B [Aphelenchoides besseyi]